MECTCCGEESDTLMRGGLCGDCWAESGGAAGIFGELSGAEI